MKSYLYVQKKETTKIRKHCKKCLIPICIVKNKILSKKHTLM